MGILDKIAEIEREIARTQKNKATEYHLGLLKAKLAKYRSELLEPPKSAGAKGEGFDVMKYNKSATLYDCLSSFIYTQFPLLPNTEVYMSKQILLSK